MINTLQDEISVFLKWFKEKQYAGKSILILCDCKRQKLFFKFDEAEILCCQTVILIGIDIFSTFKINVHISNICQKRRKNNSQQLMFKDVLVQY